MSHMIYRNALVGRFRLGQPQVKFVQLGLVDVAGLSGPSIDDGRPAQRLLDRGDQFLLLGLGQDAFARRIGGVGAAVDDEGAALVDSKTIAPGIGFPPRAVYRLE